MIDRLEITNFKCLEHLRVEHLAPLTLIGGKNNVGKSALLEACYLFFDRQTPQPLTRNFVWHGVRSTELRPESLWAPAFSNYDMSRPSRITAATNGCAESLTVTLLHDFRAPPATLGSGKKVDRVELGQDSPASVALEFSFCHPDHGEQKMFMYVDPKHGLQQYSVGEPEISATVTYLGSRTAPATEGEGRSFGELDKIGEVGIVEEILRILEPRLRNLALIPLASENLVYGDIGLSEKIPVVFMGDGVSRLLSIVLAMSRAKSGIALIDEFDNGLHHSVRSKVWHATALAAKRFKCQVLASTHSYEFLNHVLEGHPQELRQDFQYLRLERTASGIVAKSYDYEMFKTAIETGMELR